MKNDIFFIAFVSFTATLAIETAALFIGMVIQWIKNKKKH